MLDDLDKGSILLADRAHDTDVIRSFADERGAWANIPPKSNRKASFAFSKWVYQQRNLVERFFNKLKQFRGIATRYDKKADNYATHKHPKVMAWLKRHPRWTFHFTPTSSSWLNAVENFFSALTRRRIRRGVFHSIVALQTAINRYIEEHNRDSKPFRWAKPADQILEKLDRVNVPSV